MLTSIPRALLHALADSRSLERVATRHGMTRPTSFGRRFVAGETIDDAIDVARTLQQQGFSVTLNHLGARITSLDDAAAATRVYVETLQRVVDAGIERHLSITLSQLGLDIDRAVCTDNLRRILERARRHECFVRIDMARSAIIQPTLDVFTTLWEQEYRNLGVTLQAAIFRSEPDLEKLLVMGARVRLVKGSYREVAAIAHQKRSEVDATYRRMIDRLLRSGNAPAIATHDPALIDHATRFARDHDIGPTRFEFQMLYGVRTDVQRTLSAQGYRVRLFVPFGHRWFPYFMRRVGEHPSSLGFVIRELLVER